MYNEKLKSLFNLEFAEKRASKESFLLKSYFGQCFIHAQGFFSQIRGAKFGSQRPTRIIYDDVTHGERVFSQDQRDKAERQFKTDIKQASQPDTNHIFIGTVIHAQDLLNQLAKNPAWIAKKYKAIIDWPKNLPLWEEWEGIWRDPSIPDSQRATKTNEFYNKNKEKMNEGCKVLWPEREDITLLNERKDGYWPQSFRGRKANGTFPNRRSFISKYLLVLSRRTKWH